VGRGGECERICQDGWQPIDHCVHGGMICRHSLIMQAGSSPLACHAAYNAIGGRVEAWRGGADMSAVFRAGVYKEMSSILTDQ
jgi:hypothetical protein